MLACMEQWKSVLAEDGKEVPRRVCLPIAAYLFGFAWPTDGQVLQLR